MKKQSTNEILKAIPLGGHGEIGKNCWIFEYKEEIIIVNFGMMLPGRNLSGVDLVLPSTTYLEENKDKIKGLVLTSAHDDSCGGVFYLLNKTNIPKIWGSKLALETIKRQIGKNTHLPDTEEIVPREEFQIGENFFLRALSNTSILPDTYGLFIKTTAGNILYTGSYKIDQTPPDKVMFDYYSYSQAGEDSVDLLISDSANIESPGYSQSESLIKKRFGEIFSEFKSKIIIVGYASSLHKYQIIFNLAQKAGKKIVICGDYLNDKIQSAVKAGLFNIDKNSLINEKDIDGSNEKELVILVSGKYGDFLSALIEIAKQQHPKIKLNAKDVVVISANPPPGTARILAHTIDQLFVQKIQVIGGRGQGVHVSGHAAQEEAKFILTVVRPRSFAPSHGEERQMVTYGSMAETMGTNPNDIHILKNGDILELRDQVVRFLGKISAQSIYYNHATGLDIDEITMKERQTLSAEGTITVALTIDNKRNIIAGPEIIAEACSFAKGKDWRAFCLGTIELLKEAIKQSVEKDETDLSDVKSVVKDTINKSVLELIGKRPLINVVIQETQGKLKLAK